MGKRTQRSCNHGTLAEGGACIAMERLFGHTFAAELAERPAPPVRTTPLTRPEYFQGLDRING
ncbi:hypothetical protein WME99_40040 [Sorangium sp. So ce136]|uniref:hypothetical protein n=1 Tax=Sorangium sp. So ce136 TaxID=3133284 RepID=UPI003F09753B